MDMEPESESHVEAQGAKVHSALEDQAPHIGHLEVKGPKGRNRSNRIKSVSLKTCFGWSHVGCRSFWFGELNMHIPTVTYSQLKSSHDKSSKNHQRDHAKLRPERSAAGRPPVSQHPAVCRALPS